MLGAALGAGHSVYVDGSAETDGLLNLAGGQGDDTLIGGAGDDAFDSGTADGGEDTMIGGGGADGFYFGSDFDAGDHVDGGAGSTNAIFLNGDYSAGLTLGAGTITNIASIHLGDGRSYDITLVDANVVAGSLFYVNGEDLTSGHTAVVDGSQETDGNLYLLGGGGKDKLTSGAGDDLLVGNGGADQLKGGAGSDTFIYAAVTESVSSKFDSVRQFDAAADKFQLWFTVTAVDSAVAGGALTKATFDSDLAASVGAGQLGAFHAVLFTPSTGDQAGKTFLIVDANGAAGYQANADLVINLPNLTHVASFDDTNFI